LKFSNDGQYLIAAVGQEHKLGRWERIKESKNSIAIIKFEKNINDKKK
jgi:ribosomal RNA-processing protein 9